VGKVAEPIEGPAGGHQRRLALLDRPAPSADRLGRDHERRGRLAERQAPPAHVHQDVEPGVFGVVRPAGGVELCHPGPQELVLIAQARDLLGQSPAVGQDLADDGPARQLHPRTPCHLIDQFGDDEQNSIQTRGHGALPRQCPAAAFYRGQTTG
jgi:hypothetical protein